MNGFKQEKKTENYWYHRSNFPNGVIAPNFDPEGCSWFKSSMTKWYFLCTSTVSKTVKSRFVPEAIGNATFNTGLVLPAMTNCRAMGSEADCWMGLQTNWFPVRPSSSDQTDSGRYRPERWHRLWRTYCRGMSSSLLHLDHYSMPSARFFAQDSHSPRIGLQTFLLPESEIWKNKIKAGKRGCL